MNIERRPRAAIFCFIFMYQKDFDGWNVEKKQLEDLAPDSLSFHEREIWWCSIGVNLGDEQDGKNSLYERPILVLKKFSRRLAWVLPMTTKAKTGIYYEVLSYQGMNYTVILSQLRLVSVKRFRRFIRKISPQQFAIIQQRIVDLIK